jgi:hypothetical protein
VPFVRGWPDPQLTTTAGGRRASKFQNGQNGVAKAGRPADSPRCHLIAPLAQCGPARIGRGSDARVGAVGACPPRGDAVSRLGAVMLGPRAPHGAVATHTACRPAEVTDSRAVAMHGRLAPAW